MKKLCVFFMLLLFAIVLLNEKVSSTSMNTGFSTETLTPDEQDSIISKLELSTFKSEPKQRAIDCFDVNNEEMIAIGSSDSGKKTICVYSGDGVFQYGYSFEAYGSFGMELDQNNIIIYLVRNDLALEVNPVGEVVDMVTIRNTIENNSYWHHSVFSKTRTVENTKYIIKNDMGILNLCASTYSQLIKVKDTGETTIIYDVNTEQFVKSIVFAICVVLYVGGIIWYLIWYIIKLNQKGTKTPNESVETGEI